VKAVAPYLALTAAVLVSCAAPGPAPTSTRFTVTAPRTPFYRWGPAQATGADFVLMKGQDVTLLKRMYGFSQVMTADGQSGYVATEDIGPAPDAAPVPKTKKSSLTPKGPVRKWEEPVYTEPPQGLPDQPTPTFRY
jgi:hypothetical protein